MRSFQQLHDLYRDIFPKASSNSLWYNKFEEDTYLERNDVKKLLIKENVFSNYSLEDVKYNINSMGFRTKEFDEFKKIDLLLIGDCHTLGYALPERHSWGFLLADKLGIDYENICNLSLASATPVLTVQLLSAFLNCEMPRPKFVCIFYPRPNKIPLMRNGIIYSGLPATNHIIREILGDKATSYNDFFEQNDYYEDAIYHTNRTIAENISEVIGAKYADLQYKKGFWENLDPNYLGRARDLLHFDKHLHNKVSDIFIDMLNK